MLKNEFRKKKKIIMESQNNLGLKESVRAFDSSPIASHDLLQSSFEYSKR